MLGPKSRSALLWNAMLKNTVLHSHTQNMLYTVWYGGGGIVGFVLGAVRVPVMARYCPPNGNYLSWFSCSRPKLAERTKE